MATTKTTDQIVSAYNLINKAKLTKLEDSEKFILIKIARQLKKTSVDFEDFLNDAQEKLKPDNFDEIADKMQMKKELTADESATVTKYNKDVSDCLKDELDKEVELTFEPVSDEMFGRFIASNDFSVSEMLTIADVICA